MANKELEEKYYTCPDDVINSLRVKISKYEHGGDTKGYKRAKGIVDSKRISYQQMKRLKNYFDNYEGNKTDDEYILNGGERMGEWVNTTLGSSRDAIYNVKRTEMNAGKENAFRKTHTKDKANANPTNVNIPKIGKGSTMDNIMNNRVVYESLNAELSDMLYLMKYMDNNKTNII